MSIFEVDYAGSRLEDVSRNFMKGRARSDPDRYLDAHPNDTFKRHHRPTRTRPFPS